MAAGVTIVEVLSVQEAQKGLILDVDRVVYPSGLWAVSPVGWVEYRLGQKARTMMDGHGFCFVDPETWDLLKLDRVEPVEV